MTLISIPSPYVPLTPKPRTQEEKVNIAFSQATGKSTTLYLQLEKIHTDLFNHLWKNDDVSIEEFLVKYGKDATKLFQVSSKIQEVLIAVNPDYVPLVPTLPVTFHEDGTATTL